MNRRRTGLCSLGLLLFVSALPLWGEPEAAFSAVQWEAGDLEPGMTYRMRVTVANRGSSELQISLQSTCGCLTVDQERLCVGSGGEGAFTLSLDTTGESGALEKILIIRTNQASLPKSFFAVTGRVAGEERAKEAVPAGAEEAAFLFFYTPSCRDCRVILEAMEERRRRGELPGIRPVDIMTPQGFELYEAERAAMGGLPSALPLLTGPGLRLSGKQEILRGLDQLSAAGAAAVKESPSDGPGGGAGRAGGPGFFLTILGAGLLDGINPCAFTTLIFLLAVIGSVGGQRREVLLIGLIFTASVFVTYFLVGAGILTALRYISSFSLIAQGLRLLLVAALLLLGILSFIDYRRIKAGRTGDILLQLPGTMKRRIHKRIRRYVRSAALYTGALSLGAAVSLFELGCTGQIYFPTLVYMIQSGAASAWGYLALYNAGFIFPLLIAFIGFYFGLNSEKLTKIFQKNAGRVKLFTTILFLLMALLTILI